MRRWYVFIGLLLVLTWQTVPLPAAQRASGTRAKATVSASAKTAYEQALARERALRATKSKQGAPLSQLRTVIRDYESIPRRFPRSGYSDNALFNAANLAFDAHIRFGAREDRDTAVRLLQWLVREYPSSSLTKDAQARLQRISAASPRLTNTAPVSQRAARTPPAPAPAARELANANIATTDEPDATAAASPVRITNVQRAVLPEVVRVTIELDGEVPYNEEQLQDPSRLFFDFSGTAWGDGIEDGERRFDDGDVAREIRLGTHPGNINRVVIDTADVARHSLFTLYNPYRLVVDLYRGPALTRRVDPSPPQSAPSTTSTPAPSVASAEAPPPAVAARAATPPPPRPDSPIAAAPAVPNATTLPAAPESNSKGGYSIARQLGLGVSRIVIDPGHGGHDPGAVTRGLRESEVVLDVALRLEKLLKAEGNIDVVLTRRTDVFIPLQERTRIANRQDADLFLSIHANSSRNRNARGVETYVLNFATNREAEEVAARENATASGTMRQLPDIVKAITLNNKLDESRDLAELVQTSMVSRLKATNSGLRDLGVKQAPFVVLIGAAMPSVLAEISFVSHPEEGEMLKTAKYRQEIAEALRDAVLRYQRSLKTQTTSAQ
jgi:N-acetylmuramoyl-L-alanine amidase